MNLKAPGSAVNNSSLEELLKGTPIDPDSQKPYVELLAGSKKVVVGQTNSVLARRLNLVRHADGITMQKMLKSYTGLDKKFVTEGPWAQVRANELA